MNKLEDKIAIITGGAGGIGKGIATAYVKEGATVVIVDMNEEMGKKAVKDLQKYQANSILIQANSMFIQADLAEHNKMKDIIKQVIDKYGQLDILVNNAHASKMGSIEETTQEDFDLSFNTGFYPTFYLMQAALPYLKESKGNIINFASGAGMKGDVNQVSYAVAKEAIRALTRVAANEFGEFGINVNLIAPIANTPGVEAWKKAEPEYYEEVLSGIPMRRFGDPEEDIGRVAVFLASDDSGYITGQTLMVDGGSIKLV